MENSVANDSVLKNSLKRVRTKISLSYFHGHYLESLLEQLEERYDKSSKWQSRRAVIDFVQNMVFSNLFIARSFTKQIHRLIRKYLSDEQFEVRLTASTALRGFYQCGFIQHIEIDLVRIGNK